MCVQSFVPVTFKTRQIGLLIFQIVLLFLDRRDLPLRGARKDSNQPASKHMTGFVLCPSGRGLVHVGFMLWSAE